MQESGRDSQHPSDDSSQGDPIAWEWTVESETLAGEIKNPNRAGVLVGGDSEAIVPRPVPGYKVLKLVAEGGNGEVWEAVQASLNRLVAVKRIRQRWYDEGAPELVRQFEMAFRLEAVIAGFLDHPAIVPVYDLDADSKGRPLLAMKLLKGRPWNLLLKEERETLAFSDYLARHLPILRTVAQAVAFAHSKGIMHRDLKANQVVVGEFGEVYLMDWGLAAVFDVELAAPIMGGNPAPPIANKASHPAGTYIFMAPEQVYPSASCLGPWTDIFQLGGMLYLILTGTPPHRNPDRTKMLEGIYRGTIEAPEARAPGVPIPPELSAVALRAMAANPRDRPASAAEVVGLLDDYLGGASRLNEATQLIAHARAILSQAALSYREGSDCEELLSKAILLCPDLQETRALYREALERSARGALARGDLSLARAIAGRMDAGAERDSLFESIDEATRRREKLKRLRRVALAFSVVFFVCASVLGFVNIQHWSNAAIREQRVRREQAQSVGEAQRAKEEADLQAQSAKLAADLAALYRAEAELGASYASLVKSWNFNNTLEINPDEVRALQKIEPARIKSLGDQREKLAAERDWLTKMVLGIAPEPYDLLLYSARLDFVTGGKAESIRGRLERAASAYRDNVYPMLALARLEASRGNYARGAEMFLAASDRARGTLRPENELGLTMWTQCLDRLWKDARVSNEDILIEPRGPDAADGRYREVSGEWRNADKPAEWARSVARGTTRASQPFGTRVVRPSEKQTTNTVAAVARYYPRVGAARKANVYVTWPVSGNATPVVYSIHHADGVTSVSVAQDGWGIRGKSNANRWMSLGSFIFLPGDSQFLEICAEADVTGLAKEKYTQVQADAVLFSGSPLTEGLVESDFTSGTLAVRDSPSDGVAWLDNVDQATQMANKSGKQLLVYIFPGIDRERWAAEKVFADRGILSAVESGFVPLRVRTEGNTSIAWKFRTQKPGTLIIEDSNGSAITSLGPRDTLSTGALSQFLERGRKK